MKRKTTPAHIRATKYFTRQTDSECWPWTGALDSKGYGRIRDDNGVIRSATRIMWEATNGPVPAGLNLLHKCDNRPCVNPSHLFLGTFKENTADMHRKDRGRTKLSSEQVRQIRALLSSGKLKQSEIAFRFNVKEACIQRIATWRTWAWVI